MGRGFSCCVSVAILDQIDRLVYLRPDAVLEAKSAQVIEVALKLLSEAVVFAALGSIGVHEALKSLLIDFLEGIAEWLVTFGCDFIRYFLKSLILVRLIKLAPLDLYIN